MAQPRFQLRLVRRRPPGQENDRRLITDNRAGGHDDRIVWRLLGANNRELGRSGVQFLSVDEGLGGIQRLVAAYDGGLPVNPSLTSSGQEGHAWWWTIRMGDDVLAVAVRAFSRRTECLNNFATFSHAVIGASLPTDLPFQENPLRLVATDLRATDQRGAS